MDAVAASLPKASGKGGLIAYRGQKDFACAAIYIDQSFSGGCGTDQGFSGALYGKAEASAPGYCHISIDF